MFPISCGRMAIALPPRRGGGRRISLVDLIGADRGYVSMSEQTRGNQGIGDGERMSVATMVECRNQKPIIRIEHWEFRSWDAKATAQRG